MFIGTQVLLGSPQNLFVFDFGRSGTGSAPFTGDESAIVANWELVQRNVSISGSKGTLYRRPAELGGITILGRE